MGEEAHRLIVTRRRCLVVCVLTNVATSPRVLLLKRSTVTSRTGSKMLKCQICKEQVDILAHQIRDGKTVDACLDCADRYYQWFLTQELIASEKRGA